MSRTTLHLHVPSGSPAKITRAGVFEYSKFAVSPESHELNETPRQVMGGYTERQMVQEANLAQQRAYKDKNLGLGGRQKDNILSPNRPHINKEPIRQPSLSIPRIASDKENDEDDGLLLSPRRVIKQVGAIGLMLSAGAGLADSVVHALQGHKMTEEQAAICLQAHWRRREAVVTTVERQLAAEQIQTAFLKFRERKQMAECEAAEEELLMLEEEIEELKAATLINNAWRAHLARAYVRKLRGETKNKSLRRTLSFTSRRKKKPAAAATPAAAAKQTPPTNKKRALLPRPPPTELRTLTIDTRIGFLGITLANVPSAGGVRVEALHTQDLAAAAGLKVDDIIYSLNDVEVDDHAAAMDLINEIDGVDEITITYQRPVMKPTGSTSAAETPRSLVKRVKRSLSFDRKSSDRKSEFGNSGSVSAAARVPTSSCRRTFVLERGPDGLGLELDATNTVVGIKAGSRAHQQGLMQVGDTVLSIDGRSCAGKLLVEVIQPGRAVYVVELSRPVHAPPGGEATQQKPKKVAVKRSLSFDRRR
jgi:hypothetical protein